MMPIKNSCCFTGHRPKFFVFGTDETHPDCIKIKEFLRQNIERLIVENAVTHFISGGAEGVDTWAMEAVVALKRKHPHITLECALPYMEMPDKFDPQARDRYYALAKDCDTIIAVSPAYDGRACMDRRNAYMVDHAEHLIAVWTGKMTGTGRTVQYARSLNRQVFCLNPAKLKHDI